MIFAFLLFFLLVGTRAQLDYCVCKQADETNFIKINIPEDQPVGSILSDLDFKGGLNISVKDITRNPYVQFEEITKKLKLIKKLYVSQSNPFYIDIELVCTFLKSQSIKYRVYIKVEDTNDHSPQFRNAPFHFNISENCEDQINELKTIRLQSYELSFKGTIVLPKALLKMKTQKSQLTPVGLVLTPDIVAEDLDPRDKGQLTYSIVPDNAYSSYFNFTMPSRGRLFLQKKLNYHEIKQLSITIQVKDNSYNYSVLGKYQPQRTSNATVHINVLSISTELPFFVEKSYTLNLDNSYDESKEIVINNEFSSQNDHVFSIVEDEKLDDWRFFSIDESRGVLKAKQRLTKLQYILQIQVRETSRSLFATSLLVINRISKATFTQETYEIILQKSTSPGSRVGTIELSNKQLLCGNTNHVFKITENKESAFFDITNDGRVILKKAIDATLAYSFRLMISLYENSIVVDEAYLNVSVVDKLFKRLSFTQDIYEFEYYNQTYIGKVEIKSQFPKSDITYSIISKTNTDVQIDNSGVLNCIEACLDGPIMVTARYGDYSDSSMVLLNRPSSHTSDVDYKAAFIVSIIIASLLLFAIVVFAVFLFNLYRRKSDLFEENFNNISNTFSEESSDPLNHNRKPSKLDKLQGILVKEATDLGTKSSRQTNSQKSIDNEKQTKKLDKVFPNPLNDPMKIHKETPVIADPSLLTRTDLNTSQDTINASIMTLTRPAVGTNGITVYY